MQSSLIEQIQWNLLIFLLLDPKGLYCNLGGIKFYNTYNDVAFNVIYNNFFCFTAILVKPSLRYMRSVNNSAFNKSFKYLKHFYWRFRCRIRILLLRGFFTKSVLLRDCFGSCSSSGYTVKGMLFRENFIVLLQINAFDLSKVVRIDWGGACLSLHSWWCTQSLSYVEQRFDYTNVPSLVIRSVAHVSSLSGLYVWKIN